MAAVSIASAAQAPIPVCDRLTARPGALLGLEGTLAWGGLETDASATLCDIFLRHQRPTSTATADAIYSTGETALQAEDYDRAVRHFTAALEVRGLSQTYLAFLYSERGRAFNAKGDFERAIDDFTTSLRHAPQDTTTLYRRGVAYWNAGDFDRSVADFTTAIRLDPEDTALYRERGDAYRAMGRLDNAMEDLNRALKSDPEDAKAHRYRAAIYERRDQPDLAIADYTAAIRLAPDEAAAYLDRGVLHHEQSNYQLAVEDYSAALRIDADDPQPYNNRCLAYSDLGLYERAIADCGRAIDLKFANLHWAYKNRASAYLEQELYDRAIQDYTKALEIRPDYASALYGRGRAFEATGETDRARQDYEEAYHLVPNDPDYRAAYLAGGPAPLISAVALALIGASVMGVLGYRERWRLTYTWALMLAGLGLSMWAFAYYS
jgi:tetratricopeptide (TPR) repeat protein